VGLCGGCLGEYICEWDEGFRFVRVICCESAAPNCMCGSVWRCLVR